MLLRSMAIVSSMCECICGHDVLCANAILIDLIFPAASR